MEISVISEVVTKEIYLAGGCFWGIEKYLSLINGIVNTEVGYANGNTQNPSYEDVCHRRTGHAEAVKVSYNPAYVSLEYILILFYEAIDPLSKNRQGNDVGLQYRTGIYYTDVKDLEIINESINRLQQKYNKPIAIEIMQLQNYFKAEEYHQKYLDKNPRGYCHIGADKLQKVKDNNLQTIKYQKKSKNALKNSLSKIEYEVTQNSVTEPPFLNRYFKNFKEGIYVDITT